VITVLVTIRVARAVECKSSDALEAFQMKREKVSELLLKLRKSGMGLIRIGWHMIACLGAENWQDNH